MSTIFKTIAWPVASLVSSVENGTIQLPDLQRPFVWPATKVRDLFDSMYRGYPVGELQRLTSLYAAMKGEKVPDRLGHEHPDRRP